MYVELILSDDPENEYISYEDLYGKYVCHNYSRVSSKKPSTLDFLIALPRTP